MPPPGGLGGNGIKRFTPVLRPALRDMQDQPWRALCPRCGGEQYELDPLVLVQGNYICTACARRAQATAEERKVETL